MAYNTIEHRMDETKGYDLEMLQTDQWTDGLTDGHIWTDRRVD